MRPRMKKTIPPTSESTCGRGFGDCLQRAVEIPPDINRRRIWASSPSALRMAVFSMVLPPSSRLRESGKGCTAGGEARIAQMLDFCRYLGVARRCEPRRTKLLPASLNKLSGRCLCR